MRAERWVVAVALAASLLPGQARAGDALRVVTPAGFGEAVAAERGTVLLLNFWASWCSPCLKEIPELVRLERDYARCGLRLLGLSMDEPADHARIVAPLLAQRFGGFRTLARDDSSMDAYASVVDGAWNELMPTSYVIDREGRTASRIQGGKSYEEFEALVKPLMRCPAT